MYERLPSATVNPTDLKKCWELRQALVGGSIDVELYRNLCGPGTDAIAAGTRVTALLMLIQLVPEEALAGEVVKGQPSDAFLEAFARTPLTEGLAFSVDELLHSTKEKAPTP